MGKYGISQEADLDLEDISFYTYLTWGERQADIYLAKMSAFFQKLSDHSTIGREASDFQPDLKCISFESHMIFYVTIDNGIFIVRVLGQ